MADVVQALEWALGDAVHADAATRAAHRRDRWVLSELADLEGESHPLPLAVVTPRSTGEVATVLEICRSARTRVVAYGGGSGVCGAVLVPEDAIVLSTRELRGLARLDPTSQTASFRAGTNGMEAERAVAEHGLTLGHWPQSIELSTVGGWVATRASGQFSTAYGNIEDLVLDLEVVLPDASVLRTRRTPRAAAGPDLRHLFLGSEGILGIVTEVGFSLRRQPEARRGQAFHFADFAAGLEPIRSLVQAGWRPPVVRLYDAAESARHFADACPPERAALILLHEGPQALVDAESRAVSELCRAQGGRDLDAALVDHWLETRNRVPGFGGFLEKGIVLDTIEVACTWDRVAELYARTTAALREVPGILLASAHSSHSYRSGTNLYVTFVARPEQRARMPAVYRECWRRTMETALELGAGIAHHHGVGRVRRDYLPGEVGEAGIALLRAVKRALDPENLLNPGALLRLGHGA
jgi:alkyldihydroxyacetonephosphate synthase